MAADMPNARDLRLQADYDSVRELAAGSSGELILESARGRPPDEYVLVYTCRSIERVDRGKPVYREYHRVRIKLAARYPAPSAPPMVHLLTPLYHPHVYPNSDVCIGTWQTTEFLDEFVLRIGALIQYDRRFLNVRDPANEEAMAWASKNLILFPTDDKLFGVPVHEPEPRVDEPVEWEEIA